MKQQINIPESVEFDTMVETASRPATIPVPAKGTLADRIRAAQQKGFITPQDLTSGGRW